MTLEETIDKLTKDPVYGPLINSYEIEIAKAIWHLRETISDLPDAVAAPYRNQQDIYISGLGNGLHIIIGHWLHANAPDTDLSKVTETVLLRAELRSGEINV